MDRLRGDRGAIGDVSDGHAVTSAAMGCVETLSVAMTGTVREQGAAGRDIAAHVEEAGATASAIEATTCSATAVSSLPVA